MHSSASVAYSNVVAEDLGNSVQHLDGIERRQIHLGDKHKVEAHSLQVHEVVALDILLMSLLQM